jgi:hypothetical protein
MSTGTEQHGLSGSGCFQIHFNTKTEKTSSKSAGSIQKNLASFFASADFGLPSVADIVLN